MKKTISILGIAVLLLVSCGNETTHNQPEQKEDYRYVEIEECSIPIPKKFKELEAGSAHIHRFFYRANIKNFMKINISKNRQDDYIDSKNTIMQNKSTLLKSDFYSNHFKIIKWDVLDSIHDESNYRLFGFKTNIYLINSNEKELNYLLAYCTKTWKLNKGEK